MQGTIGPFELVSRLGAGGMGEVHLAHARDGHPLLAPGTTVALKLLPERSGQAETGLARFVREARAGMLVEHPNVAQTLDVGLVRDGERRIPYIAMEYIEGESLVELQERLGRIPESLCLHIAAQAARGLAAVHEAGLVHRDVKPGNLMLDGSEAVKLVDLGVALFDTPAAALTMEGAFVGTRRFAAPEQQDGIADVDARADLYALGATLFELALGRAFPGPGKDGRVDIEGAFASPVAGASSATVVSTASGQPLSPFFVALLETLLAADRMDRFQDAHELLGALVEGEDGPWYRGVLAATASPRPAATPRLSATQPTTFVGRETELAGLASAWETAQTGHGGARLLLGPAGLGKSRLLDAFLAARDAPEADPQPPLIVRTSPGTGGDGMRAFLDALVERHPPGALRRVVSRLLASYPGLAKGLLAAAGGTSAEEGTQHLSPSALRTSCGHLVRAMAREAPLIVVMEDLHTGGESARELFAAFAAIAPTASLLVLGTARAEPVAAWLDEIQGSHGLELERLDGLPSELLAVMARALAEGAEVTATALSQAVDLADGNPLFLIELVEALLADAKLGAQLDTSKPRLPKSLKSTLLRRVNALERPERELLELAACIGFQFDPELLARAHARTSGSEANTFFAVTRDLATIRNEHRVIRDAGRAFVFDHALLHETIYTKTPEVLREQIHGLLAELLSETPAERGGAESHEIVRHWLRARRPAEALPFLDRALEHLERRSAHAEVFHILEQLLDDTALAADPRRAAFEMRLIQASRAGGRLAADTERLERAVTWLREAGHTDLLPRALVSTGQGAILREALDEALATMEEAVELAEAAGDEQTLAAAQLQLGRVSLYRQEHAQAEAAFEAILAGAGAAADPLLRARALGSLAVLPASAGSPRDSEALLRECAAIAREHGDSEVLATALGNLTFVLSQHGNYGVCAELAREMLQIARQAGDRIRETFAIGNLAAFERGQGHYAASGDALIESLQVSREIGDAHGEILALLNMAANATNLGDLDRAEARLDEAEARIRSGEDAIASTTHALFLADLLIRRGQYEGAAEAARRAFGQARDPGDQALGLTLEGWALAQAGDTAKATERLRSALGIADEMPTSGTGASALVRLALLGHASPQEAHERLAQETPLLPMAERIWCSWKLHQTAPELVSRDEVARLVRHIMEELPEDRANAALEANPDWKAALRPD